MVTQEQFNELKTRFDKLDRAMDQGFKFVFKAIKSLSAHVERRVGPIERSLNKVSRELAQFK